MSEEELTCSNCNGLGECDDDCNCDTCLEYKAEAYREAMMDTYD